MNWLSGPAGKMTNALKSYFEIEVVPQGVTDFRRKSIAVILSFYAVILVLASVFSFAFHPVISYHDIKSAGVLAVLLIILYSLRYMKSFFLLWFVLNLAFFANIALLGVVDRTGLQVGAMAFAILMPIKATYFIGRVGAIGSWLTGMATLTFLFRYSLSLPPTDQYLGGHTQAFDLFLMCTGAITLSMIIALTLHQALLRSLNQSQASLLRAQQADDERTRFFGTISHEVRNSLNGIFGITNSMLREELAPDLREKVELVQASGNSLIRTLNASLEVTRLETGNVDIVEKPVNLRKLIKAAVTRWQFAAEDKGLTLTSEVDPAVPDCASLDETRIGQILDNLVSNAVKFTKAGDIHIALTSAPLSERRHQYSFRVSDTGAGIHPDQITRIFEPYRQASAVTFARFGGTGLGLYICRLLADQMGGTIDVEKSNESGTVFRLDITALTSALDDIESHENSQDASLSGLKVLAVDDRLPNRRYLETLLSSWDIDIRTAASGAEVLDILKHESFDLLFLDVNMPEMSGLELLRKIRSLSSEVADMSVIVISADGRTDMHKSFEALGAKTFVVKPITPQMIWSAIEEIAGNTLHSRRN